METKEERDKRQKEIAEKAIEQMNKRR